MKTGFALMAMLFTLGAAAAAQVVPATTGLVWPPVSGTLSYRLNYSQMATFYGGPQGDSQTSSLNGEATYANTRRRWPFHLTYSGGKMWNLTGAGGTEGYFQHLLASQGFIGRAWAINVSNNVSLTPEAPVYGFSGIPGIGTLPSQPGPPTQPILTLNTNSIDDTTSGSFSRTLNPLTSLGANASFGIVRFPDGGGLETDQMQLGSQISRRLDARNSLSAQYAFSRFTYPGFAIVLDTQSLSFGFQRRWTPHLSTSASGGPQWVMASKTAGLPASTNLSISASAAYKGNHWSSSLSFSRATMGSAGALTEYGATNNDLTANYSRQLRRYMSMNVTGAYMRTEGLRLAGSTLPGISTGSEYGGVSISQKLGRYFNASANYTVVRQTSTTALSSNAINGLLQTISFGIGYSPRAIHLRK